MILQIKVFSPLIILVLCATLLTAQESVFKPPKVLEKKVVIEASKEIKIPNQVLDIDAKTPIKGIVLQSSTPQMAQLFILNLEAGEQQLVDEFSTMGKNPALRPTGGGIYISYNVFSSDGTVFARIYNTQTTESLDIKHPEGKSGYADVNPQSGKILYQVYLDSKTVKVYVADKNGENHRFMSAGSGARWSPDGKWFYLLHRSEAIESFDSPQEREREPFLKKENLTKGGHPQS